jgi:hypothetical protein
MRDDEHMMRKPLIRMASAPVCESGNTLKTWAHGMASDGGTVRRWARR